MGCRRTIVPLLMPLLVVMLVMGAVGCGVKNQSDGSEDRPLSPVEGRRGSESIVFSRNDNPAMNTSETDHYFIIDKPGDSPTRIDRERMLFPAKTPDGNSLAYLSPVVIFRAMTLYDIDTGSERVFQVVDTIEDVFDVSLGEIVSFSWAPDGRSVYVCINPAPDANGNITLPVRLFRFYLEDGSCRELSLNGGAESQLGSIAVSPSGTRIFLNEFWCGDLFEYSVQNIRKVIPEPTETDWQVFPITMPIWLNDHEVTYIEKPGSNLVKLDVDTGVKTIVLESTPQMLLGWAPRMYHKPIACSPEGDRILFPVLAYPEEAAESEAFVSPLYIINAEGTGLIQATDPEKNGPAWGDTWPCWASR
jgi:hypothetical protein